MKSEFEKLLSNCQNRVNGEVKVINISNGSILEVNVGTKNTSSNQSCSTDQVRPGIKNLIKQKMRETQDKVEQPKDKATILFSLKDFQEKKNKLEEKANSDKDEINDDDLNEDDECVRDVSFDNEESDDAEMFEDVHVPQNQENNSDIEEVEIVKNKVDTTKPSPSPRVFEEASDPDLETELIKLDNIQREVSDRLKAEPSKPATVLLKMNDPAGKTQELIKNQTKVGISISKEPSKGDSKPEARKKEVIDVEAKEGIDIIEEKVDTARKKPASQGVFKNISISVVGGRGNASKNIDIQDLFNSKQSSTSKPPPSSSSKSSLFNAGPNISLKRKSSPLKPTGNCLDKKRFKSSAIVITPSISKAAPTIVLDEVGKKEEDSPTENLSSSYDNCTHGDLMGYLCLDCIYLRWKTAYEFVKTRKEEPKKVVEAVEKEVVNSEKPLSSSGDVSDEPADIIKNVNWQQVFCFAGISVEQSQNQRTT